MLNIKRIHNCFINSIKTFFDNVLPILSVHERSTFFTVDFLYIHLSRVPHSVLFFSLPEQTHIFWYSKLLLLLLIVRVDVISFRSLIFVLFAISSVFSFAPHILFIRLSASSGFRFL